MRTWLVWAFLIDKYVAVHLNENDPNKNTYSIHKQETISRRAEKQMESRETPHLAIPNGHQTETN